MIFIAVEINPTMPKGTIVLSKRLLETNYFSSVTMFMLRFEFNWNCIVKFPIQNESEFV